MSMPKFSALWRIRLQTYWPWLLGAVFLALVFLVCGLSHACSLEEIRAVFCKLSLWVALRSIFRELWCFALLLLCMAHFTGVPVAVCVLCIRAYSIGFSWGWWLSTLGFRGFLSFFLFLLPQGILVLFSLCCGCSIGLAHAFRHHTLDRRSYVLSIGRCFLPALAALLLEWAALCCIL